MRLVYLILVALSLAACATTAPVTAEMAEDTKVELPKDLLNYCTPLPAPTSPSLSEPETLKLLNSWVTAHEACASEKKALVDFIRAYFNVTK